MGKSRAEANTPDDEHYRAKLHNLQVELVKLQRRLIKFDRRLLIIIEGRETLRHPVRQPRDGGLLDLSEYAAW